MSNELRSFPDWLGFAHSERQVGVQELQDEYGRREELRGGEQDQTHQKGCNPHEVSVKGTDGASEIPSSHQSRSPAIGTVVFQNRAVLKTMAATFVVLVDE